jgi:hypothetical protein
MQARRFSLKPVEAHISPRLYNLSAHKKVSVSDLLNKNYMPLSAQPSRSSLPKIKHVFASQRKPQQSKFITHRDSSAQKLKTVGNITFQDSPSQSKLGTERQRLNTLPEDLIVLESMYLKAVLEFRQK